MLSSFYLHFTILLVLIVVVRRLALRRRPRLCMGVGVPLEQTDHPGLLAIRHRYVRMITILGALAGGVMIFAKCFGGLDRNAIFSVLIYASFHYFYGIAVLIGFSSFQKKTIRFAQEQGWYPEETSRRIVDTSFASRVQTPSALWLLLFPAIIGATWLMYNVLRPEGNLLFYNIIQPGVSVANSMTLLQSFDHRGYHDAVDVGRFKILALSLQVWFAVNAALLFWGHRHARQSLRPNDPQESAEQDLRYRLCVSRYILFGYSIVLVLLGLFGFCAVIQVAPVVLTSMFCLCESVLLIGLALKLSFGVTVRSPNVPTETLFFYRDPEDTALFAKKSNGLDIRINLGRPFGMAICGGMVLLAVGLVTTALTVPYQRVFTVSPANVDWDTLNLTWAIEKTTDPKQAIRTAKVDAVLVELHIPREFQNANGFRSQEIADLLFATGKDLETQTPDKLVDPLITVHRARQTIEYQREDLDDGVNFNRYYRVFQTPLDDEGKPQDELKETYLVKKSTLLDCRDTIRRNVYGEDGELNASVSENPSDFYCDVERFGRMQGDMVDRFLYDKTYWVSHDLSSWTGRRFELEFQTEMCRLQSWFQFGFTGDIKQRTKDYEEKNDSARMVFPGDNSPSSDVEYPLDAIERVPGQTGGFLLFHIRTVPARDNICPSVERYNLGGEINQIRFKSWDYVLHGPSELWYPRMHLRILDDSKFQFYLIDSDTLELQKGIGATPHDIRDEFKKSEKP